MKKISFLSLVLLIVAAIDSIRNLPATAVFGSSLIFFFIFAALIFLIPVALVSAELAAKDGTQGGVYHWILRAFGEKWAMIAIWLQWINTLVWYPTILSFIAATIAYLIDPDLAQNPTYLMLMVMGIFWTVTLINLKGIDFSVKVNSFCATIGTIMPMCLLFILGAIWYLKKEVIQINLSFTSLVPDLTDTNNWVSLIAIMASFLGMELSGVHVNDIKNPQKNFPKAVFISALFILISMMMGSLAIAIVIPQQKISLVSGVMQVFDTFFNAFNLSFLTPVIAVLIVIGSMGGIINWILSPAKGLLHAAEFNYLPKIFLKKNKHHVASSVLIMQACVVSLICLIFQLVPSVNSFYWFLTALSTGLYMMMYVLMFFAVIKLKDFKAHSEKVFQIPFGLAGKLCVSILGLFGCLATIYISYFPPSTLQIEKSVYFKWILFGNIFSLAPVLLFFGYKKFNKKG